MSATIHYLPTAKPPQEPENTCEKMRAYDAFDMYSDGTIGLLQLIILLYKIREETCP